MTMESFINYIKRTFNFFCNSGRTLVKWLFCSVVIGVIVGLVGTLFHHMLNLATDTRYEHPWFLLLLPAAGLIIVLLCRHTGAQAEKGTNLVIAAIQSGERVPLRMTPLIIISTTLTHLFGGSAGREGAALQIGGSLGNYFAKLNRYDEKDTRIAIMCGMSACFSALFGTPMAAAVFSMEVISVGIMQYAALVPSVVAALIACHISEFTGLEGTHYDVTDIPALNTITGSKAIVLAIVFSIGSIVLCIALHKVSHLLESIFHNEYLRIVVAALIIIILRYVLNTTDYLGAGTDIIAAAFVESCAWYVCILKIIFTSVTLGGGFKGGEIVPTLFVGATIGSCLAPLIGLPVSLCAACGMVSVFCGVTNCPLTSLLLAIEMFGSSCSSYCILCIAVTYLLSGYFSLYNTQKIVYSKYRPEFINRKSR